MARYKSPFERGYRILGRLVPFVLASPLAVLFGLGIKASYDEEKALQRARELSPEGRQAIVEACIRIAGTIQEDIETQLIFGLNGAATARPFPLEFRPLQPERVNVRKESASIKLHLSMLTDSSVFIYIDKLNTNSPVATLTWGAADQQEIWSAPSILASPSPSSLKSDQ